MPTTSLSFIIDPAGSGTRPGINLQVFPSGSQPITYTDPNSQPGRTANSSLTYGGYLDTQSFTFTATLSSQDFAKLESLKTYNLRQSNNGLSPEIVIYNLTQPFSETSTSRTRYRVPSTSNLEETSLGSGFTRFAYWVAIQGILSYTYKQNGSFYVCDFRFDEGTRLTSDME